MGRFRSPFRQVFFSNVTAILSLRDVVWSKTKARFGISAYELTVHDPSCVKVIRGHPRSSEATDLATEVLKHKSNEMKQLSLVFSNLELFEYFPIGLALRSYDLQVTSGQQHKNRNINAIQLGELSTS